MSYSHEINLFYFERGIRYDGVISRHVFKEKMKRMIDWYPDCCENARKLASLAPDLYAIAIDADLNNTQDVPCIQYSLLNSPEEFHILKLIRPFKIIWSILDYYCIEAKDYGMIHK